MILCIADGNEYFGLLLPDFVNPQILFRSKFVIRGMTTVQKCGYCHWTMISENIVAA